MIKVFGVSFLVMAACLLVSAKDRKRDRMSAPVHKTATQKLAVHKSAGASPTRAMKHRHHTAVARGSKKPKPDKELAKLEQDSVHLAGNGPRKAVSTPKPRPAAASKAVIEHNPPINFPSSPPKNMTGNRASTSSRRLRPQGNGGMAPRSKISF